MEARRSRSSEELCWELRGTASGDCPYFSFKLKFLMEANSSTLLPHDTMNSLCLFRNLGRNFGLKTRFMWIIYWGLGPIIQARSLLSFFFFSFLFFLYNMIRKINNMIRKINKT